MDLRDFFVNRLILALLIITFFTSAQAFAQDSEGYLGQVSDKYMVRGQMYNMSVYSYDFTPGIDFTSPSGQRSHTIQSAVGRPYNDGRGIVKHMQSNFRAEETGNYQMRVFSWDNQGPNMKYSMHIGAGPGPSTPPPPQPDPVINPPRDTSCPAGMCWDEHARDVQGRAYPRCVYKSEPNYCDF